MINVRFELNGKVVPVAKLGNALQQLMLNAMADNRRARRGSIRHPDPGEIPTIVISGASIDDMKAQVEGSPELLEMVKAALGQPEAGQESMDMPTPATPRVFLSYASEDHALAQRIAQELMASGIDTWWAEWEIKAGDSIRQRIDQGLEACSHFVVLMTPVSTTKPWVKEEIDAAFVRKVSNQSRFSALRHDVRPDELPPLLRASSSPSVGDPFDLSQLINDIHGVTKKPPLGSAPQVARSAPAHKGFSQAANVVAKIFVEESKFGRKFDPSIRLEDLVERTGLSEDDVADAVHELGSMLTADRYRPVVAQASLFVEFDAQWKEWDPTADALALAVQMQNDSGFPTSPTEIDGRLQWGPRRLNPALTYLADRNLIRALSALDGGKYVFVHVSKTDETRRFVKSRSG